METISDRIHGILKEYWGYRQFRPLQQEIIEHVLQGRDALALLPTGGGKSVCFQVPAMAMRGVCLVVSPLIALMKDQVENLGKRGIPAAAIYGGLSRQEMEWILNGAVHGRYKFLYVSPERCQNEMFLAHLRQMQVCLLAVDEAHCISQWGYDFRPPYLQIAGLRPILPGVPLLALTATATPDVVEDIQEKLQVHPRKVFRKSFGRENLVYYVIYDEDKMGRLERIVRKLKGSGIVYTRSRRRTVDVSMQLQQRGIPAACYHAGLPPAERSLRQDAWMAGKVQVMVATNAFGMGIDKPDVRFVVHLDLPDTLEAYFQEAGRAGRDGRRSFALLVYHDSDRLAARENFGKSYPSMDFIRRVYDALGNYCQVPAGCGEGAVFPFDLRHFCHEYVLPVPETASAVSFLERAGYFRLSDSVKESSRLRIIADYEVLYRYQVEHPGQEALLQALLRVHGGRLFSDYAGISEKEMARRCGQTEDQVRKQLALLHSHSIVDYRPLPAGVLLWWGQDRLKHFPSLPGEVYAARKAAARRKLDAVIGYATEKSLCRSRYLLQYFGEEGSPDCGSCDVCIERKHPVLSMEDRGRLLAKAEPLLQAPRDMRAFMEALPDEPELLLRQFWNELLAEERIVSSDGCSFSWNQQAGKTETTPEDRTGSGMFPGSERFPAGLADSATCN